MTESKLNPYQSFSSFIFRSPCFHIDLFTEWLEKLDDSFDFFKGILVRNDLKEAIFLASSILYGEIPKYLGERLKPKERNKFVISVLKYLSRMASRCTPFGLFAGFSLGHFGDETNIELADTSKYCRHTRLDMNYLCGLSQDICKLPEVRAHLKYFTNVSIYSMGEKLRYVDYFYKGSKRVHNICAVDNSIYLTAVLEKALTGCKIDELAALLVKEDTILAEATAFIHELIDNQILISELEPAITGKDFLGQIIAILSEIPAMEEMCKKLTRIASLLIEIDNSMIGNSMTQYLVIEDIIKELGTTYEPNFLFQTDMFKPVNKAVLDKNIIQSVQEALELMNKLTIIPSETLLSKFAERYYERYEEQEAPLLEVLDTETGIGYRQISSDISPLVAGYVFPEHRSDNVDVKWDLIQSVLHTKYLEAYKANAYTIIIEEKDFNFLEPNWNDLPTTLSCMCEIFCYEVNPLIYIHGAFGSSAANLLGRFCHVNKELENYVREITTFEQSQNQNTIYAEIVHLPESRTGNILLRPVLRPYEIPYLGKSSVSKEFQIPLSDLYISVRGKRIFLRSKRLNKEIVPRMSTAHNYANNSMPVYHFLCDMQTQGLRSGLNFSWSNLYDKHEFLPRITYKNVILSLARWTIKTSDFIKLLGLDDKKQDDMNMSLQLSDMAMSGLKKWCKEKQLPHYVTLPDGDNALFVDMESILSILTLISVIKKRPSFQLEEFPFDKDKAIVKDKAGRAYTNEFIFGLYKSQKHE